jgi:hypothetical protein
MIYLLIVALFSGLHLQAVTPNVSPVEIKIIDAVTRGGAFTVEQGHGDLKDPQLGWRGFDFVAEGCRPFEISVLGTSYHGRWKEAQRLTMLTHEVGSNKTHECTMKVTVRPFIYRVKDGKLSTSPVGSVDAKNQ